MQYTLHMVQLDEEAIVTTDRRSGAQTARGTLDRRALQRVRAEPVGLLDKGWPPALWGRRVDQLLQDRAALSGFPTPLVTLDRAALTANIQAMATWTSRHGIALAPHGKTTMAPQLWQEQLDAGAWGITVANLTQLAVARAFGVSRVQVANALISPLGLRWVAEQLAANPHVRIVTWADSTAVVDIMAAALAGANVDATRSPLDVLVELGGDGGRTGARTVQEAMAVARAVAAAPTLRLAGVTGYEGALAHDASQESLDRVRAYLLELVRLHQLVAEAGWYGTEPPLLSAGGSAYPDVVADVLGPLAQHGEATVLLRSGAYVTHDDGYYRQVSPWGRSPRTDGAPLRAALHGWVRVSSRPEPGLAIVDGGKRDLPFDEGLPKVQLLRGRASTEPPIPVTGLEVTALNDQHGFVRLHPGCTPLAVGDELRLGLSHPCTTFDKWRLIPVVDDADAADPVVVDAVRTFF